MSDPRRYQKLRMWRHARLAQNKPQSNTSLLARRCSPCKKPWKKRTPTIPRLERVSVYSLPLDALTGRKTPI